MKTIPPHSNEDISEALGKAPDFSRYMEEHPVLQTAPLAGKQHSRRFSLKQIAATVLIIGLAAILGWSLVNGNTHPAGYNIPAGYRLAAPGKGPPKLEKIK